MSNKPKSRKRNIVNGTLQEINKDDEALNIEKVGESVGFLKRIIRRFKKDRFN